VLDYLEAGAAREAGRITAEQFAELEASVMPGSGTCGAMFTANTMSTLAESIGKMLPHGASHPADNGAAGDIHDDVRRQTVASVDALFALIDAGVRPRDVLTTKAFENAITTLYAMGGSTNLYLHVLAVAREAGVRLDVDRIHEIGARVPLMANLQPHGPFSMVALHQIGGLPVVMRELLDHGYLHGDALTVTGKTVAENLSAAPSLAELGDQQVVRPVTRPGGPASRHTRVL
jgi:dihydroxy-acid dehydratase